MLYYVYYSHELYIKQVNKIKTSVTNSCQVGYLLVVDRGPGGKPRQSVLQTGMAFNQTHVVDRGPGGKPRQSVLQTGMTFHQTHIVDRGPGGKSWQSVLQTGMAFHRSTTQPQSIVTNN